MDIVSASMHHAFAMTAIDHRFCVGDGQRINVTANAQSWPIGHAGGCYQVGRDTTPVADHAKRNVKTAERRGQVFGGRIFLVGQFRMLMQVAAHRDPIAMGLFRQIRESMGPRCRFNGCVDAVVLVTWRNRSARALSKLDVSGWQEKGGGHQRCEAPNDGPLAVRGV